MAIVIGETSGIGCELRDALGRRETVILVMNIDVQAAKEVALGITAIDGIAHRAHLDVTQAEYVQRLIEETASEHGHLHFV